jgi:hypothetical protein
MSQEQQQFESEDAEPPTTGASGQQQQQPQPENGHAGQGSESIMKQLREWESRRAGNSGGKRRQGPN